MRGRLFRLGGCEQESVRTSGVPATRTRNAARVSPGSELNVRRSEDDRELPPRMLARALMRLRDIDLLPKGVRHQRRSQWVDATLYLERRDGVYADDAKKDGRGFSSAEKTELWTAGNAGSR